MPRPPPVPLRPTQTLGRLARLLGRPRGGPCTILSALPCALASHPASGPVHRRQLRVAGSRARRTRRRAPASTRGFQRTPPPPKVKTWSRPPLAERTARITPPGIIPPKIMIRREELDWHWVSVETLEVR